MSNSAGNHLSKLAKRADYLTSQLAAGAGSPGVLGHYRAELEALRWAMPALSDMVEREQARAHNVARQQREAAMRNVAGSALLELHRIDPALARAILSGSPVGSVRRYLERRVLGYTTGPPADPTRDREGAR